MNIRLDVFVLYVSETIQEIGKKYNIHPHQISTWKTQFLSRANSIFEKGAAKSDDEREKAELFKKVGELQMQVDFLKKCWGNSQSRKDAKS